uniref:Uncharacterized protein n=1 Tax=Arundo donax TaxID=35708 RepID=A0A0A8ZHT3_ARUDO
MYTSNGQDYLYMHADAAHKVESTLLIPIHLSLPNN